MELVVMCDPTSSVTNDLDNKIVLGKSNILRGYNDLIITMCVKDNLIISGSNRTIHIRDIIKPNGENKECVQILTGHNYWVKTICVKDNLIISGSYDSDIRIWDMTNTNSDTSTNKYDYKCVQVLKGHTSYVMSIYVKDNVIISGSYDGEIRIWDTTNTNSDTSTNKYDYKCIQILTGHTNVTSICVIDNLIISGSCDKTIRIWDIDDTSTNTNTNTNTNKYDYKCVQVLTGHTNYVTTICVKDSLIISGSYDGEIRIWDMTNTNSDTSTNKYDYKCIQILTGHTGYVTSICVIDNLIISGSRDETIRIWYSDDTSTKYYYKCVQVLTGYIDYIMSICVKDNLIICGPFDCEIHVTPINLFPNELHIFKILINNYHLVSYLQTEILDYFRGTVQIAK